MSTWIVVVAVGLATILLKAAGPVFVGGRPLPGHLRRVVDLLAPVMLTALVVTQTVGGDGELSLDARIPGVVVGGVAVWRQAPIVVAMAIAALVTAAVRLV
jgi:branched-subunit amino acid transport protein